MKWLLLLVTFFVSVLLKEKRKNIIFMVSDGMGPASLSLARSFRQHRDQLAIDDILNLDHHLIGSSRTRSSSSLVTDSAAGATLFSCALKTYNNAVGVDPRHEPCGTILELLKLEGYFTGLVVTTRITDLTPLLFSSHVDYRFEEDLIAQQQLGQYPLGRMVDLMIGGGRCHFHPHSDGGCRTDDVNLIDTAKGQGWTYAGSRSEFDDIVATGNASSTLPLLLLLLEGDIPYDLDRDDAVHPSLEEEAKLLLKLLSELSRESEDNKGFFLLIEGSRIDHLGHSNDPLAQVREVLLYDKAFKAVLDFIDASAAEFGDEEETIVISTSDHETGGLATLRQVTKEYPDYIWYPELLLQANHSGEFVARKLADFVSDSGVSRKEVDKFIAKEILEKDLGIHDYTKHDIKRILQGPLLEVCNNLVSLRSQTGWSTHGHSAVDVNIYAYASNDDLMVKLYRELGGNHENIEMGKFMESWTGVDLLKVTKLVKKTKHHEDASYSDLDQIVLDMAEDDSEESVDKYHHFDEHAAHI